MNILLDSNSFNFLYDNQDNIKKGKTNLNFFISYLKKKN